MKNISIQNGKLVTPSEFDELRQTKLFIDSISRGLADSENGDTYTTSELKKELKKARAKRKR